MDPYKQEDATRPYKAFWYSLDLFAPVINLEVANMWRPKDNYRWGVRYMRVHKIMGWLLVPLGVAAWTRDPQVRASAPHRHRGAGNR
jgi:hypothetical protein